MGEQVSPVRKLASELRVDWKALAEAEDRSKERIEDLRKSLRETAVDSEERSVVAFGSLARYECTEQSDLDWTLLIDGEARADDLTIAQRIQSVVEGAGFREPGPTELFGSMAFSHDIIHRIGGQKDTNQNMTQRILLLLESRVVGSKTEAYDRVVKGVLERYLSEEANLRERRADGEQKVPRFLLNDVVRFWRTMAVDFASKQRERGGDGWGIRNIKLRMSRKLIFVAGLLMCFSCRSLPSERVKDAKSDQDLINALIDQLLVYVGLTPLEIVADAIRYYGIDQNVAKELFGSYDEFIRMLSETDKREALRTLRAEESLQSELFRTARDTSDRFQEALTKIFFENDVIAPLTRSYGVF